MRTPYGLLMYPSGSLGSLKSTPEGTCDARDFDAIEAGARGISHGLHG